MSNQSGQEHRGEWRKEKKDKGLLKRGGRYYIRFADRDGKLRVESTGSPSRSFARDVLEKRRTEVREGRYFPKPKVVTVDEIIKDATDRAREHHELQRPGKKFRPYRYRIVGEWFKGRDTASLTPQEIGAKLAEQCKTPANFNRYRVALSHAFKLAVANGKVADNPARHVRLKKEGDTIRWLNQYAPLDTEVDYLRPLKNEEARLRAVIQKRFPAREPELDLALGTGLRFSEQYNLRWRQVDLKRNQLTLLDTKSGGTQYLPIGPDARAALKRLRALAPKSELVCPDEKLHRAWWDAVRAEARIARYRWHDNRHTFASRLVQAGVPILVVNKLMRHATLQMTMRYAHLAPENFQDALALLSRSVSKSVAAPAEAAEQTAAIATHAVN
jgi:integrase